MKFIKLDSLKTGAENVRRTAADAEAAAQLRASIAAHGLLQNLVVKPLDPDGERFAVVAGNRRLAALQALVLAEHIPDDYAVPCLVLPAGDATGPSLAENVARQALHPADEVEGFLALKKQGSSIADIASAFGVTERQVRARLALGNCIPPLLQAWRAGEISLEKLRLFAVASQKKQRAVFKKIEPHSTLYALRRDLFGGDEIQADEPLVRFVGLEVYQRAGGTVREDIFVAESHLSSLYLSDRGLLDELAENKLSDVAEKLRAHGWSWVESGVALGHTVYRYQSLPGPQGIPEHSEIDKLSELEAQAAAILDGREAWALGDDEALKYDAVNCAIGDMALTIKNRAAYAWGGEDMACSGCLVYEEDGRLVIECGLQTAAQMRETHSAEKPEAGQGGAAPEKPALSKTLRDDLRTLRAMTVSRALVENPPIGINLLCYILGHHVARGFGLELASHLDWTTLEASAAMRGALHSEKARKAEKSLKGYLSEALDFDWMREPTPAARFAALSSLDPEIKRRLMAAGVALTLQPQLADDVLATRVVESAIGQLAIDWTEIVPGPEVLEKMTKKQLLALARDLRCDPPGIGGKKKSELVAHIASLFADRPPAGLSDESRAAIAAYVLPGFAPAAGEEGPS